MTDKNIYGRRRTEVLQVRLSGAELSMIKAAAAGAGLSVSAWARQHLVRAARKELRTHTRWSQDQQHRGPT